MGLLTDGGDQDLRRGRTQPCDIVVLSHPEAMVAERFGRLGDLDGLAHGLRLRRITCDR